MLKDEFPEAIADKLGIPPIHGIGGPWMSSQGTVLKDWLDAVGEALDIPYAGEKTRMMRALVESVGESWNEQTMSSKLTNSEGGGNISVPAFEALLRGLENQPAALRRIRSNQDRGSFHPQRRPFGRDDRTALRAIKVRAGQPQFRATLLNAYRGQCAVTDCDAPSALDAAHVVPYGRGGTYHPTNGLLLRSDVHNLFDLGLVGFDDRRRLELHSELIGTSYERLAGNKLAEPSPRALRVPDRALAQHRRQVSDSM